MFICTKPLNRLCSSSSYEHNLCNFLFYKQLPEKLYHWTQQWNIEQKKKKKPEEATKYRSHEIYRWSSTSLLDNTPSMHSSATISIVLPYYRSNIEFLVGCFGCHVVCLFGWLLDWLFGWLLCWRCWFLTSAASFVYFLLNTLALYGRLRQYTRGL